eukprot:TRINITY_DN42971_c0_g1_i1.p1 TRINITY_DN42971_c0_g1~~TRINITY_DN42971_c0_g1_i1.p1  ORF type:complete len:417 (-),score=96.21 TRINITY_DN42971_c0_g1_i1:151-1401(-)
MASTGAPPNGSELQPNTQYSGSVKNWLPDKGFGFVCTDSGVDVFVHAKQLSDGSQLTQGARVTFECRFDPSRSKYAATTCSGATGGPPPGGFQQGGSFPSGGGGGCRGPDTPATGNELPQGAMINGTVRSWLADKGFGFLIPDQGGPDVFIHAKQLQEGTELYNGQAVQFSCRFEAGRGKYAAQVCMPMGAGSSNGGGMGGGCGGGNFGQASGGYGNGRSSPYMQGGPQMGGQQMGGGQPMGGGFQNQGQQMGGGFQNSGMGMMPNMGQSPLPAGWCEAKDPNTGNSYYYHEVTREVRWDRPGMDMNAQQMGQTQMIGQQQMGQQQMGQPQMGQQQMMQPQHQMQMMQPQMGQQQQMGQPQMQQPMQQYPGNMMGGMGGGQMPLPEPWKETRDPNSGNPYYYNTMTNEVRWDRPTM